MRMAWIAMMAMMIACGSWAQAPKVEGTTDGRPTKKSQSHNGKREDHYPTKDAPLPVIVIQSIDDATRNKERETQAEEFNNEYLDTQRQMAGAAKKQVFAARLVAGIALADGVIGVLALWFLRGTYLAARAQLRPRFFVRELLQLSIESPILKIQCAIGNAGEAKGIIVERHINAQICTFDEWRPGRPSPVKAIAQPIVPGAQICWDIDYPMDKGELINLASVQEHAQQNAKKFGVVISGFGRPPPTVHLQGFIVYVNDQRIKRRTAFLRCLDPTTLRFQRRDDPDYEYAD